jgi:pimeloyl-ACP methyl ester carboxylesterase
VISLVDDLPVYYESFGEGRPIVFLPGWGNANGEGRDVHEPVFAEREGWRRIYLDPPGTGNTPSRPWIKNQDDMLHVLTRAIDNLLPGEPLALAGTSAGGLHARGFAHHNPGRVLGLLLRVPGVVVDRTQRTLPEPSPMPAAFEEALQEKQERYYPPAEQQADLEFLGTIQQNGYALSFDPATRLEVPVLIVTGRQDTITGYADAWPLLQDYPHATYAVLDRADHDLPVQNHSLYRALVADWLDRMEHPGA